MHDIILTAVMDSVEGLKAASKGLPNNLVRDINAIHANAAFADLPREVQAAISSNVRAAFNRLLKEGYSVAPAGAAPERRPPPNPHPPGAGHERPRRDPRGPRSKPGAPRPGGPKPGSPKPGGSKPRTPKPR